MVIRHRRRGGEGGVKKGSGERLVTAVSQGLLGETMNLKEGENLAMFIGHREEGSGERTGMTLSPEAVGGREGHCGG